MRKKGWRKGDEMYVVAVNGCICSCRIRGENPLVSSNARTLISLRKEAGQSRSNPFHDIAVIPP